MSLLGRWRFFLFSGFFIVFVLLSSFFYLHSQENLHDLRQALIKDSKADIKTKIDIHEKFLKHLLADWGYWDDTYAFMQHQNPQKYLSSNFGAANTLELLGIDAMLFLDTNKTLLYGRAIEQNKEKILQQLPGFLHDAVVAADMQQEHIFSRYVKDGHLALIYTVPIRDSAAQSSPAGILVAAQILTPKDFVIKHALEVQIKRSRPSQDEQLDICYCEQDGGYCIAAKLNPGINKLNRVTIARSFLLSFIVLLIAYVATYFFALPVIRRIVSLTRSVRQLNLQRQDITLPRFEIKELDDLSASVEKMASHLQQNNQMMEFLLQDAPAGIIIYQPTVVLANQYALQHLQTDMEYLQNVTPDMLVNSSASKEQKEYYKQLEQSRLSGEDNKTHEYTATLNIQGHHIDVLAVSTTVNYHGKPAGMVCFLDITKQKNLQLDMQLLMQTLPVIVYRIKTDKNGKKEIYVSQRIAIETGFDIKEVTEDPTWWQDHIHKDDLQRVMQDQDKLLTEKQLQHTYRLICKDGSYIWIADKLMQLQSNEKTQELFGYWENISEMKLYEKAHKLIARINTLFLLNKDVDTLYTLMVEAFVTYGFCERAVIKHGAQTFAYPDEMIKYTFEKIVVIGHGEDAYVLELYFGISKSMQHTVNKVFPSIIKALETGASALLHEQQLQYMSYHDPRCGLENRNALYEYVALQDDPFSLVMINVHAFSGINLLYGFEFGNQVLCTLAATIRSKLRDSDRLYHLSGDRFCIFTTNGTPEVLSLICEKITHACSKDIFVQERFIPITCSYGVASYPLHTDEAQRTISLATTALSYANKNNLKHALYSTDMEARLDLLYDMETELLDAIEKPERFKFHYQPTVNAATQKVESAEALIRLSGKDGTLLNTEEMIHVAEELGHIKKITRIALQRVCEQLALWSKNGLDIKVALNLSADDIEESDFLNFFEDTLIKNALSGKNLAVEITERTAVKHSQQTSMFLDKMKTLGISVEIDDFGIAHSSLSLLSSLEFDIIKIDKSFIDKILTSQRDRDIVSLIIDVAHVMDAKTIAEGVETQEQYRWLKEAGCDLIQGYYFSKPLSVEDFEEFLENNPL